MTHDAGAKYFSPLQVKPYITAGKTLTTISSTPLSHFLRIPSVLVIITLTSPL
jgi:hypothetical protein